MSQGGPVDDAVGREAVLDLEPLDGGTRLRSEDAVDGAGPEAQLPQALLNVANAFGAAVAPKPGPEAHGPSGPARRERCLSHGHGVLMRVLDGPSVPSG